MAVPLVVALALSGWNSAGESLKLENHAQPRGLSPSVPPEIHSEVGDSSAGCDGRLRLVNIGKRQQYDWRDRVTLDTDIYSPKSASFHPDGKRCYVNSLEGCKTVVYAIPGLEKTAVIEHRFQTPNDSLWASPSGYYPHTHYPGGASRPFSGKPVEGVFSHSGRYFWVPYYRRTFDINAQDPSAVAVIDTYGDSIVRMFESGPLPKMVAYSEAASLVAITHWGDNTVGLIDVSSPQPAQWRHLEPLVAGSKLVLDFPLDKEVDRDAVSGHKLRGTVFTPDGRYLFVGAMGGAMHVFDIPRHRYVGHVDSAYGIRHLVISGGVLYGSQNIAASVVSIPLDSLTAAIAVATSDNSRKIAAKGWRVCKVGNGARTLEASPDGEFLFVACNSASEVCVVDAATMSVVDRVRVDSYPVGLAVSGDGEYMAVTSQGRNRIGGNALNLFRILRPDKPLVDSIIETEADHGSPDNEPYAFQKDEAKEVMARDSTLVYLTAIAVAVIAVVSVLLFVIRRRARRRDDDCENG